MPDNLNIRIKAFATLGTRLDEIINSSKSEILSPAGKEVRDLIDTLEQKNPWFTRENTLFALKGIIQLLQENKLTEWLSSYPELKQSVQNQKTVAVIMAGNLPFVGFHDFMCVLLSGHIFLGKLSSQDNVLPVSVAKLLCEIDSYWQNRIIFTEERITDFDVVIATGSNNSARYFEYYFGKYPNIIRKNRSSIAVLTGNETDDELNGLSDDIFLYFGMGCRSISKIFIPRDFNLHRVIHSFEKWSHLGNHYKFANNYDYHKAVYLVNKEKHLDNGFILMKEDQGLSSPLAVLYYQYYNSLDEVESYILTQIESIQCIATQLNFKNKSFPIVPFGATQLPQAHDYADGVDTITFLLNL